MVGGAAGQVPHHCSLWGPPVQVPRRRGLLQLLVPTGCHPLPSASFSSRIQGVCASHARCPRHGTLSWEGLVGPPAPVLAVTRSFVSDKHCVTRKLLVPTLAQTA